MRRNLALFGLPVLWAACFSSTNGPPPDASLDASPIDAPAGDATEVDTVAPEPEAAVDAPREAPVDAALEAAPETSSPVDAPIDAPVEAAPSPVVVTIVGATGPEQGIPVVWGDVSGAAQSTTTTDATGSTSMLVSGGMITALLGSPSSSQIYTITGIEPGDDLVIVDWTSLARLPSQSGSYVVDFTSVPASPPTAASSLSFLSGYSCSSYDNSLPFAPPATVNLAADGYNGLEPSCLGIGPMGASYGSAFPALVQANDIDGNMVAFAFANGNSPAAVDDAGAVDVAIGGAWSTSTTAQTVSLTNAPSDASPWVDYSEVASGVLVPLSAQHPLDGGLAAGESVFATHQGFADFVQVEMGVDDSGGGFTMIATRSPPPTADGTITLDASELASVPVIMNASVDTTVPARPDIGWTTASAPLTSSTALIASIAWTGTDAEGGPQGGSWTIFAAAGSRTDLQAPALPTALSGWAPVPGASFVGSGVAVVQGNALPGYAQVRAASSALYPVVQTVCIGYVGPGIPPLPADGTLMVSYGGGGCG
jgi:hypothetical protein